MDVSHVRVHFNSPVVAQHNALAYAQGADIHLAPGQGHRLAHEAWHIVQQRQGRVGDNLRTHIGLSTDPHAREVECAMLARRTP
jgi:hypothetical protein